MARLCLVSLVSVKVSVSLTDVGSLSVEAFDLENCFLSVVGFVPVSLTFFSVVIGLWAT